MTPAFPASSADGLCFAAYGALNLQRKPDATRRRSWWLLLLILPYLGLCFPQIYARSTPALWGFPFFYWYQFAWVILASALLAIVYRKLKT